MPDITMCEGSGCSMKDGCYRHTAKPNEYLQSYFQTPPFVNAPQVSSRIVFQDCDYFWDNEEYK